MSSSLVVPFLNDDILSHIFHLNTHARETERGQFAIGLKRISPLDSTRRTSQVCRSWRQIILQSPCIWGNTIDLLVLGESSEEWVGEVLKRTGNATLSIYGMVEYGSTMRIFKSLLDKDWHRVRRVDILINDNESGVITNDPIWDIFWQREAPNLENFLVLVHPECIPGTVGKGHDLQLFSGSAPMMRRMHSPQFCFDFRADWISQLHSVTLSHPFTTLDVLNVIARTPRLESLIVEMSVNDDEDATSWTQKICLPNLHFIDITSSVAGSLVCLSNVTARSDCALRILIQDRTDLENVWNPNIFLHLSQIIVGYAERYFTVRRPTKLNIHIELELLDVGIASNLGGEAEYFEHPSFRAYWHSRALAQSSSDSSNLINVLTSTLATSPLDTILDFQFLLSVMSSSSWNPAKDKTIHTFRSLISVKNMTLSLPAMNALNNLPDTDFESLFPRLTKLTIQFRRNEGSQLIPTLRTFLSCRKAVGNPVRTILLKPSFCSDDLRGLDCDLGDLPEFEGSLVFYKRLGGKSECVFGDVADLQDIVE